MRKFSVHPLFIAFALVLVFTDKSLALINTVVCCVLHELGHVRAAKTRGYRLNTIVMMPYGAMVTGGETLHPRDEAAISFWGPAVNLILAAVLIALWWIFPESYRYTQLFALQNLSIAVFNLLPIYPLDMSRILLAGAKNKKRMLSALRMSGFVACATFLILFVLSCSYKINYSLAIAAVMFFFGGQNGIRKEVKMYQFNTAFLKDARHPVERKHYRVSEALPITRVLRLMSPTVYLEIEVVGKTGQPLAVLQEEEFVRRAAEAPPGATMKELLSPDTLRRQN